MAGYVYRGTEFDAKSRRGRKPRPFDPALCGTPAGMWQHRRVKETGCVKCREVYNADRRQKRSAA